MDATATRWMAMVALAVAVTVGGCAGSMSGDGVMKKDGMSGDKPMSGDKMDMSKDKDAMPKK